MFIDPNNDQWNTILTSRPDSLAGWFRCAPMENDNGMIKVCLSTDSTSLPATDSSNWVAYAEYSFPSNEVTEWKRFSVPFVYYSSNNPTYILAVLSSSAGFDAVENSKIWFDDLELIYPTGINDIENYDLTLYGNGNSLNVFIKSNKREKGVISLIDLNGKLLYRKGIETNIKQTFTTDFTYGLYIAVLNINGKKFSKKIMFGRN
jgi:hypothetical protein